MIENSCQTCGNELFLKEVFEDSYNYWCPYCAGFISIDKEIALDLCEAHAKSSKKLASNFCSTFSREDLISYSLNRRELSVINEKDAINIKVRDFITSSLIIKDCLNGCYGGDQSLKENMGILFSRYDDLISSENLITQVSEDYVFIFESHPEIELAPTQIMDSFEAHGKNYLVLPSYKWGYFIDAVETVQFAPLPRRDKVKKQMKLRAQEQERRMKALELELSRAKKNTRSKIEQKIVDEKEKTRAETLSIIYNSMCPSYFNFNFFAFNEIRSDSNALNFMVSLLNYCKEMRLSQPQNHKNDNLYYEIGLDIFDFLCGLKSLDCEDMYRMLVSSEENCKEFPLLVDDNLNILICPETLFLVSSLILFASNIEKYNSDLGFRGTEFEHETRDVFESCSFSLEHPLYKNKSVTNKKIKFEINGNKIQREIDLLPYNDEYLFVVDCKRNSLRPKYILNHEKQNRAFGNDGIKDEIENKHIDRVNYFENNQIDFGFKKERKVKGLIVTLIKEDIETYKGIDVVPFSDLKVYLKDFQ